MATIDVVSTGTWITDLVTATSVRGLKTDRSEQDVLDVLVRGYAGGRLRIISTPSHVRVTPLTLRGVTSTDLETLRGWRGRLLLLRDAQGWRRWGTYAGVTSDTVYPAPHVAVYEVSLTWQDVDYDESV